MFDESFNYLGESLIGQGKEWEVENSFVTEEGLNVPYNDEMEEKVILKLFVVKDINQ